MNPKIVIDLKKLKENIRTIKAMASRNGIDHLTYVVKAFSGDKSIIQAFADENVSSIGDSRIQNLMKYKDFDFEKVLLRIPMLSEVKEVIAYSDISLNSELSVIEALNNEAKANKKEHDIIIMFDLGDLREGIYYKSQYLPIIEEISKLENIVIKGIGTNLTCYGGLVPTSEVLNRLIDIKTNIENELGMSLDIISGGNSSTVTLFDKESIPNGINHLRLGESVLFGKETSYSNEIPELHHDVFEFVAEIIELKDKPSYPDGEMSINSFGEKPEIIDKGMMKRGILAIGKQDVILENLEPKDNDVEILGGSSDHLIVEIRNDSYKVGDLMKFNINYPALVHLMNSEYVLKEYK